MAYTFDQSTINSTGVFLNSELDKLDTKIHYPLDDYTWGRDITLREDVTITDKTTSFILANSAVVGGANPSGKNFIASNSNDAGRVQLGSQKITSPINLWGLGIEYSIFDLETSLKTGRPIESDLHTALRKKWHKDIDEQVYIGDESTNAKGLLNQDIVEPMNASLNWRTATPDQILDEFNFFINFIWAQTGYNLFPSDILLPPELMTILVSRKVGVTGDKSILTFLLENNIANSNGVNLKIRPSKWCIGAGVEEDDRIMAYCNRNDICRIALVALSRLAPQFRDFNQVSLYYGAIGVLEVIRPEVFGYLDGAI